MTGPYLQNVKPDGITVMWETAGSPADSLEYGASTAYGASVPATVLASGLDTWTHRAVLSGLEPGATYHYRVVTAQGATGDGTFVTAPAGAPDFSFAVWGDSQGASGATVPMMRHMVDVEHVDLGVAVGDLTEDGTSEYLVRAMFLERSAKIVGARVPFFVAWGNHDGGEGAAIRNFVELPGRANYSFDYGGCHFVCVDDFSSNSAVTSWIKSDLATPAAKQARFIFVFKHRAPWYERWYEGESWMRTDVVPSLEASQVAAVFSGHMHGYERGLLNGVYYVTTGGGSWLDTEEPLVRDWSHITVGGYSNEPAAINHGLVNEYVKVEISGSTMTAKTMGFSSSGEFLGVLDTFQLTR